MLRVGDIVTIREGLPNGANPEFTVCRVVRDGAGIIKYKLSGYAGRFFTDLELVHTGKPNVCPHQFNVGDRVVNVETDTIDVVDNNNMLHSLAYRKFTNIIENVCYRNCIWLRKVNPAWTSWIAQQKYCPKMKLNIHTGASFVIARRGQGYTDKV